MNLLEDQNGTKTSDEPDKAQGLDEATRTSSIMKEMFSAATDKIRPKAESLAKIKRLAFETNDTDLALLIKYASITKIVRGRTPIREIITQPGFGEKEKPNGHAAVVPEKRNGSALPAEPSPLDEIIPVLIAEQQERGRRKRTGSGQLEPKFPPNRQLN